MVSFTKTVNREVAIETAIQYVTTSKTKSSDVYLAVDAGCSRNPGGPIYYRGVLLNNDSVVFHVDGYQGTNNVAEFLAMVHGLAWMKKRGLTGVIFFDSTIAYGWVIKGRIKRNPILNKEVLQLIDKAELWLRKNGIPKTIKLEKWNTKEWGEIPADFGLKH